MGPINTLGSQKWKREIYNTTTNNSQDKDLEVTHDFSVLSGYSTCSNSWLFYTWYVLVIITNFAHLCEKLALLAYV